MKTIIFDIDGVLADFTLGWRLLANELYGKDVWSSTTRPHGAWNDPDISEEENDALWAEVAKPERQFWASLESLATEKDWTRIAHLQNKADVYFVTNRKNIANAKQQTEWWFHDYDIEPTVILAHDKGAMAKHLRADYAIDDKWENVYDMSHHCWSYMQKRIYNEAYGDWLFKVDTVGQFLDVVEAAL